jgi:hypothetical protein
MRLSLLNRKACAMAQTTTWPSARASLYALGDYLRRQACFAPLSQHVTIPQKTITYRPVEQWLDALIGLLCGAAYSCVR